MKSKTKYRYNIGDYVEIVKITRFESLYHIGTLAKIIDIKEEGLYPYRLMLEHNKCVIAAGAHEIRISIKTQIERILNEI